MKWPWLLVPLAAGPLATAAAQDISVSGMADFRLVAPPGETSHMDGGLGKFRWGDGRGSPIIPDFAQAVLRASWGITPELRATAQVRYDPRQKTAVDLLEAYLRYRPVSTSAWRWSVKGGAFFPPVSLENTGIGWTPEWTLTPSAVNTWIGQELRIIGGEATIEWRGGSDRIEFVAAAFGLNETAGDAIQAYGWTLNDRPIGLLDHNRTPSFGGPASYSYEFRQYDHAVGTYVGVTWDRPEIGRVALLHYDNGANPSGTDGYSDGWRTSFWSLGYSTELGPVTILAQGLAGTTTIQPAPGSVSKTDFWAYYVLAGIERGDWRYAIRFDQFATHESGQVDPPRADEHGIAGTAAVTWSPRKWLGVTGEVVAADYTRTQRILQGKSPHVTEVQAQLALRLRF